MSIASMSLSIDEESNRVIIRFSGDIISKQVLLSQLRVFNTQDSTGSFIIVDVLDEMHSQRSFRIKAFKQRMTNAGWSEDDWKMLEQHPRTTTTTAIFLGIIPPSGTANIRDKLQSLRE